MKKVWLVVALVALGGLAVNSFADVQNIRLSGDIRIRGYYLDNAGDNTTYDAFISQRTRVSVEADLAWDLAERTVVPMYRSGVFVQFAAPSAGGALIMLRQSDGTPVPLGATVTLNDGADSYVVALYGEVFVPTIQYPARLRVRWPGAECSLTVETPKQESSLSPIGPLVCGGER